MGYAARLRDYVRRGTGEAVVAEGISLSWADMLGRVEQGAAGLAAAGIGPGVVVGVTIADEVEHFVACLALLRVGAWQIALATHDPELERQAIAARAGVTHVLHTGSAPTASVLPHLAWPRAPAAALPDEHPEGGVMLRTSGTTGTMNIVPLSAAELCVQADRNREYDGGRLFRPASIEHNNSERHRLYCAALGGTNVFRPPGAFDTIAYCRQMGVTTLDLALMQAVDLAAKARGEALAGVDIRVSGSAVPYKVRRQIEQNLSRRLFVRYGSTESGTVSFAGPGEHDALESVGHVVDGIALQIVDAADQPVPAGQVGHIRMRGEGFARSYLDGAEQTARRFRDGWYWPGDMGSLAVDGRLTIHGRADDMINLNGVNIFTAEIEGALEAHPAVAAAAALPLDSAVHGQIPVAAVELRSGGVATERELVAYAREHLALRAPRRIIILDRLPRNDQGKILRREIAKLFPNPRSKS
jgi:acyl-coenzyme A synthetase/AMP-(fatty) acid ligase